VPDHIAGYRDGLVHLPAQAGHKKEAAKAD